VALAADGSGIPSFLGARLSHLGAVTFKARPFLLGGLI